MARHESPGGRHGDEPSPEDRFAGRARWSGTPKPEDDLPQPALPIPIHLTDAALDKPASVTKGVRAALRVLRPAERITLEEADNFVQRFRDGERPLLLGYATDAVTARSAGEAALEDANGNVSIGVGLTEDEAAALSIEHTAEPTESVPENADKSPADDWVPSLEACRLGLNLLAQHDGIPARAYTWAKIMRHSNPSGEWQDVMWFLLSSFPME